MSEYTPGPWRAYTSSSAPEGTYILSPPPQEQILAEMHVWWQEYPLTNARLMAAAPDLLHIAQRFMALIDGAGGIGSFAELYAMAEVAVKKALTDAAAPPGAGGAGEG